MQILKFLDASEDAQCQGAQEVIRYHLNRSVQKVVYALAACVQINKLYMNHGFANVSFTVLNIA